MARVAPIISFRPDGAFGTWPIVESTETWPTYKNYINLANYESTLTRPNTKLHKLGHLQELGQLVVQWSDTEIGTLFLTTTHVGRFGMSLLFCRSFGLEFFSHV
jgi:hypothetical protein